MNASHPLQSRSPRLSHYSKSLLHSVRASSPLLRRPARSICFTSQAAAPVFVFNRTKKAVPLSRIVYPMPPNGEPLRQMYFATGNANKLKEVVAILEAGSPLPFQIRQAEVDLPELQGTSEDIAAEKCRLAAQQVGGTVMVEDTSLCFEAYQGLPGPYIKWFLGAVGPEGLHKMLAGFGNYRGWAQCIFAYAEGPDAEPQLFIGKTHGTIVEPRTLEGQPVFGWDPVFQPDGYDQTYAQMEKAEKNKISHRFRALDQLREHLLQQPDSQNT